MHIEDCDLRIDSSRLPNGHDVIEQITKTFEESLSDMGVDAVIVRRPSKAQMRHLVEEGYDIYGYVSVYNYNVESTNVRITYSITKLRPYEYHFINDKGLCWIGGIIGIAHESHSSAFVQLYLSTMEERGYKTVFLNDEEYSEMVTCTDSSTIVDSRKSATSVSPDTLYVVTQE